jgi:SnoaL-like domain
VTTHQGGRRDAWDDGVVALESKHELFAELLSVWQTGPGNAILAIVTSDYVGHMLHLDESERDRESYPAWIDSYRSRNPGTHFRVVDQLEAGDRLLSRVEATRTSADGTTLVAHGMNLSRFAGGLIAEEWAIWTEWRGMP